MHSFGGWEFHVVLVGFFFYFLLYLQMNRATARRDSNDIDIWILLSWNISMGISMLLHIYICNYAWILSKQTNWKSTMSKATKFEIRLEWSEATFLDSFHGIILEQWSIHPLRWIISFGQFRQIKWSVHGSQIPRKSKIFVRIYTFFLINELHTRWIWLKQLHWI